MANINIFFYEVGLSKPVVPPDEGWVVYRKDLSSWFDKYLSKVGLNLIYTNIISKEE
jgi:hypothetical protein